VSSGSTGEQLKAYNALNSYAGLVSGGDHYNDNEGAPKIFVTILFFDKNYKLVDAAWDQVTTVGAQTSTSVKQPPHDLVSVTARAPEAGYAYVFLSNEHNTFVDAYFDDAVFTYTASPIVSVSDYYPFGMQYNNAEAAGAFEQKYLYNGKELQDELNLNWYDYGARMYMPELGRWGVIDPMAEKYRKWSPYTYCVDNPVRFIDPDGMQVFYGEVAQSIFVRERRRAKNNGPKGDSGGAQGSVLGLALDKLNVKEGITVMSDKNTKDALVSSTSIRPLSNHWGDDGTPGNKARFALTRTYTRFDGKGNIISKSVNVDAYQAVQTDKQAGTKDVTITPITLDALDKDDAIQDGYNAHLPFLREVRSVLARGKNLEDGLNDFKMYTGADLFEYSMKHVLKALQKEVPKNPFNEIIDYGVEKHLQNVNHVRWLYIPPEDEQEAIENLMKQ
jgi:RHS repeat-associated protein